MITISSREFRANQKNYLDQVSQGVEVLVTRGKDAFKISRVNEDDSLMSRDAFFGQIEQAIKEVKEGKSYSMKEGESLDDFISRMKLQGNV